MRFPWPPWRKKTQSSPSTKMGWANSGTFSEHEKDSGRGVDGMWLRTWLLWSSLGLLSPPQYITCLPLGI